jgi:hypothetical protein
MYNAHKKLFMFLLETYFSFSGDFSATYICTYVHTYVHTYICTYMCRRDLKQACWESDSMCS